MKQKQDLTTIKTNVMEDVLIKILKQLRASNYKIFFIAQALIWAAYAVIVQAGVFDFKYFDQIAIGLAALTSALTTIKDKELDKEEE
jgi:hypothetical protein